MGRAYKKISKLTKSNAAYQRRDNAWRQQVSRLKRKLNKSQSQKTQNPPLVFGSPRSEARRTMASDGLSPSKHQGVFKELVTFNALSGQIRENIDNQSDMATKQVCHRILSGKVVKKYKSVSLLSSKVNVSRQTVSRYVDCTKPLKPVKFAKLSQASLQLKQQVREYFLRYDNSRMMPGKGDYVMLDGNKVQKKVLNDYVYNIHSKFCAENPHVKVALSSFYKCRPLHCSLTKFCDRRTCLCQRHQNMALKLSSLKKLGLNIVSTSPDRFAEQTTDEQLNELLGGLECTTVKLAKWVHRNDGEDQQRTVLVEVEMPLEEFITEVKSEMKEFRGHVKRIKEQYSALKHIKGNLKEGEVLIQMDFAESYNCTAREAVQNAYFAEPKVSLHPTVVYHNSQHYSYVFVSDSQAHNAQAVLVIISKLMPIIKNEIVNNLKHVIYFTDSPTSQYRNCSIFNAVVNHRQMFGCDAHWNYFEAGHGKGPCDGIGGTAKRLADQSVRSHGTLIHNAETFHAWAGSSNQKIKYVLYSGQEVSDMKASLDADPALTVPGTMTVHSVKPSGTPGMVSGGTSCYSDTCICGENTRCDGWSDHPVSLIYPTQQWIAFQVEDEVCLGQVQKQEGAILHVKCVQLSEGSELYNWSDGDCMKIQRQTVLCKIAKPTFLKRRNGFRFTVTTLNKVDKIVNK